MSIVFAPEPHRAFHNEIQTLDKSWCGKQMELQKRVTKYFFTGTTQISWENGLIIWSTFVNFDHRICGHDRNSFVSFRSTKPNSPSQLFLVWPAIKSSRTILKLNNSINREARYHSMYLFFFLQEKVSVWSWKWCVETVEVIFYCIVSTMWLII